MGLHAAQQARAASPSAEGGEGGRALGPLPEPGAAGKVLSRSEGGKDVIASDEEGHRINGEASMRDQREDEEKQEEEEKSLRGAVIGPAMGPLGNRTDDLPDMVRYPAHYR